MEPSRGSDCALGVSSGSVGASILCVCPLWPASAGGPFVTTSGAARQKCAIVCASVNALAPPPLARLSVRLACASKRNISAQLHWL